MKKVTFVGPVYTQSGYGVHARQIARWLIERSDIQLSIVPVNWGDTPWLLNSESCEGLIKKIMDVTTSPVQASGADVSIQLQLPNEWNPALGKINIGVTAGIETDTCNPEWIDHCNKMSLVIVPSKHAKETFERTGKLTTPVIVVPESFMDSVFQEPQPLDIDLKTENNFLIVSQLTGNSIHTDRKNIFYTIKWLTEAFIDRNDVGIVLKTNCGRNTSIDRKMTTNVLKQLLSEVRSGGRGPKVHLLHGSMSDSEIASLYRHPKIKALVSLTRGEGFGLPILEAASCGLPVIATGWSGHMDFMSRGKFININHQLVPIHPSKIDGKLFVNGSKWAEIDGEDFKKKARKFIDSQSTPREWAKELSLTLKQEYSFESIVKKLNEATKEFL